MTAEQTRIKNIILDSIKDFNDNDSFLIENDLSERCICSRFALYLQKRIKKSEFSDYFVDVEYNRGYKEQTFLPKSLNGKKIVVDLIVHKRVFSSIEGFQNLICIEMKKEYSNKGIENDKERLKIFTDNQYGFCYSAGFMIVAYRNSHENAYGLKIESEYYNTN